MTDRRIAVLSVHTSPLDAPGANKAGGLNVYVLELARELAEHGCKVDIFSRRSSLAQAETVELAPGLRVVHLEAGPVEYLPPEQVFRHIDAFRAALLHFAESEGAVYDLVHSHYWLSGLVGTALQRAWGVPHVTMFHTLGEVKNRASYNEHETDLRIASEMTIVAAADRIICATEQERTFLVDLYEADGAKVRVIPLGVDLDRFEPGDKLLARRRLGLDDGRIVLFVGRLEPLKGVDILINAAGPIDEDIDCRVVIVGGDSASQAELTKLRSLARAMGIERRVVFVGAVDRDLLPLYYNAADLCVVPSHYESFGLVAVEAMASGLPVVASRVGGLTGTVRDGETGYLIPWLCPEPFAERIELLLENEPLRRSLGLAAREAVARYRWENVAGAVLQVYEELTGEAMELTPAGS